MLEREVVARKSLLLEWRETESTVQYNTVQYSLYSIVEHAAAVLWSGPFLQLLHGLLCAHKRVRTPLHERVQAPAAQAQLAAPHTLCPMRENTSHSSYRRPQQKP